VRSSAQASPITALRPRGRIAPLPKGPNCCRTCQSSGAGWPRLWQQDPPEYRPRPISGCRGLAATERLPPGLPIPLVADLPRPGRGGRARHQGPPRTRARRNPRRNSSARIALACDQVVATCPRRRPARLTGLGRPFVADLRRGRAAGGHEACSPRTGRPRAGNGRPRLLALGRLVERKGVATVICGHWPGCPTLKLVVGRWARTAVTCTPMTASRLLARSRRGVQGRHGPGHLYRQRRPGRCAGSHPLRGRGGLRAVVRSRSAIVPLEAMALRHPGWWPGRGRRPSPTRSWTSRTGWLVPARRSRRPLARALGPVAGRTR